MFKNLRKKSDATGEGAVVPKAEPDTTSSTATADPTSGSDGVAAAEPKKSLYARYKAYQRGKFDQISDEDMQKYTGKTRAEINEWGKDREDVAGNQLAGKLAMGPTSGLGGVAVAGGYGGWGPSVEGKAKFPQEKKSDVPEKKVVDDEDSEDE
jgi:hypothetical protein